MFQKTPDQAAAAHAFAMFVASPDVEFTISGPAGVGKTTLLRELMEMQDAKMICQLIGKRPITDWVLTATTNKAAEVLSQATGVECKTIHSLLGLQVRNNYQTGKTTVSRKRNAEIVENKLIVIDECSMVDSQLYKLIHECTWNCKIVYVGDHCQMAPVMETLSPVFLKTEPQYINQIVRSQHTPAITKLCQQLRQTVETGVFEPIVGTPGSVDFLEPALAQATIYDMFVGNPDPENTCRILCYTNNKVNMFNDWLRSERHMPVELTTGEFVVSNNATKVIGENRMTRVEQELEIFEVGAVYNYEYIHAGNQFFIPVYEVNTSVGPLRVPVDKLQMASAIAGLAKAEAWPAMYGLKDNIADLRPRDACTVYKAQGSTYRTVFVDLSDIGTCTNASQAARMLYVACSRPTHRVCFIGELPKRFRGE